MHDGGETILANKLRRLLAYLGVGFAISVFTEFAIYFIQAGRSLWSGGGTDVLRVVTTTLFAIACVLLALGSLRLRDRRPSARRTLLSASVIWLAAIVGILSIQVSRVIDRPHTGTSWQVVIREAQTWTVYSGALPLLLFAFVGWPELIPQRATADGPSEPDARFTRSSLAARLMRVLSVYGVVFGGTTVAMLVYLLVSSGTGFPELRFPVPLRDAFYQFGALLGWVSAALIIVGAMGELLGGTWGRHFLLIASAAWLVGTVCSFIWSILTYATTTTRHGGSIASQLPDYASMLLGKLEQIVFPVMLLVCLCWREMRVAATADQGPTGFQPILAQSPDDGRSDGTEVPPEN